jgi:hypothetical protein
MTLLYALAVGTILTFVWALLVIRSDRDAGARALSEGLWRFGFPLLAVGVVSQLFPGEQAAGFIVAALVGVIILNLASRPLEAWRRRRSQ